VRGEKCAGIDRTQGFTVTWTGGNPGSYVVVSGTSTSAGTAANPAVTVGFTCIANVGDGQFSVPPYILSALPPGTGTVQMQNDIYRPVHQVLISRQTSQMDSRTLVRSRGIPPQKLALLSTSAVCANLSGWCFLLLTVLPY
jgi:hypothetical protein